MLDRRPILPFEAFQPQVELARSAWKEEGREAPPRLVTSFWFALGRDARHQLDDYLLRYLNFMGEEAAGVDTVRIGFQKIAAGQGDIFLIGAASIGVPVSDPSKASPAESSSICSARTRYPGR